MDFSKLSLGSKVIAGAGILLLIDSFFHWQEVNVGPYSAGVNMWHGWGVLVGLILLVILAWEAAQLAQMKIAVGPLSPSMLTMLLSALLVLFTLIKVVTNDYVTVWAWIGLVLSVGVAVGAWLNMQAAGESIGDLKSSFTPATKPAAPPAPHTPPAPHAPSAPSAAPVTPETPPEPGAGPADTPT
jgi:hypothetical protein